MVGEVGSMLAMSEQSMGYPSLLVVFVALDRNHAIVAHSQLANKDWTDTRGRAVEVEIGYLGPDGEFVVL